MKICLVGAINSIHIVRWANSLSKYGHEVFLITMTEHAADKLDRDVKVFKLPFSPPYGYYANSYFLRRLLRKIKPDIINGHYASGFGTLLRLTKLNAPYLLSVWGSDVYDFPYQSKRKEKVIRKNLESADYIASTSHAMADQTRLFVEKNKIFITPFGIDVNKFNNISDNNISDNNITIGTVKTMKDNYGIKKIIFAFHKLITKYRGETNFKLLLVGGGKQLEEYKKIVNELKLNEYVTFTGQIIHEEIPSYLNKLDIYCAPSKNESFGVAILEASACEIPVIVSNAGGLPEVVDDKVTGFILENNNIDNLFKKIEYLAFNEKVRLEMGKNGRKKVVSEYDWNKNVNHMIKIYESISGAN